jgi:hypothetical protein
MEVKIEEVLGGKQKRQYIHLPARLHKDHPNWVPPIWLDEKTYYNPKKNKSFEHCDTILFLAYNEGKVAGRIMGIINHRYNDSRNEKHARFAWLESNEDPDVVAALMKATEDWAREKGMERIVGPLGFSDKDPQGLLIEGFDEPMVIATNCNLPWLPKMVGDNDYEKDVDLVVYKVDIPEKIPEVYEKIAERVLGRSELSIREFKKRKELKPVIRPVLGLMNDTFEGIYGFDRLTGKEMDEFAARYIPLLDPRFIKVIETPDKKPVAFLIGMPDLSEGIMKSRGYLFPFGIFQILRSGKKTRQLNLLLGAVHEEYRNHGLDALMAVKMLESANEAGLEYIDSHLEMEGNMKVRAEMERLGGEIYKRYRIFGKDLGPKS